MNLGIPRLKFKDLLESMISRVHHLTFCNSGCFSEPFPESIFQPEKCTAGTSTNGYLVFSLPVVLGNLFIFSS